MIKMSDLDNGLGLLMKITGEYTNKSFYEVMEKAFYEFSKLQDKYIYVISDCSSLKINDFNNNYIQQVADLHLKVASMNKDLVVAVTVNDPVTYGLANMWTKSVENSGWDIALFKERDLSDKWLHSIIEKKYDLSRLTYS